MGSAQFDLLATIDWLFPGGLDHHHLMVDSSTMNRVALAMAHDLSGLGRLPTARPDRRAQLPMTERTRVAVVGAGQAGRAVADKTRAHGIATVLLDRDPVPATGEFTKHNVIGYYDDRFLAAVSDARNIWIEPRSSCSRPAPSISYRLPPATTCPASSVVAPRSERSRPACSRAIGSCSRPTSASTNATKRLSRLLVEQLQSAGAVVEATLGLGARTGANHALDACLMEICGRTRVKEVILEGGVDAFTCDAVIWCGRPVPAYDLPRQMGSRRRSSTASVASCPYTSPTAAQLAPISSSPARWLASAPMRPPRTAPASATRSSRDSPALRAPPRCPDVRP